MKRAAVALLAVSSAALLATAAARRTAGGGVEAGAGDWLGSLSLDTINDRAEMLLNRITEGTADVDAGTAARNVAAFLGVIRRAEGTEGTGLDPYRVCYGYVHTVEDMGQHPAVSGEWAGEVLPADMCRRAGFGPGCISTAAGAYQLIRPTWLRVSASLGLADFSAASQDAAAVELIRSRGALSDVRAGRLQAAIGKCRNEWASLPGNYAGQGQRSGDQLAAWFTNEGGRIA
jgi:lysozyme